MFIHHTLAESFETKLGKIGVDMEIIIDTREQAPMLWDKVGSPKFPCFTFTWGNLKTGDYSISGMSSPNCDYSITIERKNPSDLFLSLGKNRNRFISECERMSKFDFAAIVAEIDFYNIFKSPPPMSNMSSKSVFRSLIAISQRYGIHFFPCPNRVFAEKTIYLSLRRFWDDRQPGGIYGSAKRTSSGTGIAHHAFAR
jgi:ERCC4-type nuclease